MRDILEKLSVCSSDYVAAINVEDDDVLYLLHRSSKGLVCAGRTGTRGFDGIRNVKVVKGPKNLEDSIFNKVVTTYDEELNLKSLVRIAENFGLVFIAGVPEDKKEIFEDLLEKKAGIFESWSFSSQKEKCVDFLFKVKRYA